MAGFHPVNTAAADTIAPTKYYLAVSGVNGGSIDPNHKGWFELTSYQLNSATNGGAVDIGLLSASIAGVTGYNTLLKDLVSGTAITTARLEGVVVDGLGAEKTVYQLGLGNVLVAGINDDSNFGFSVDLDFTRVLSRTFSPVTGKTLTNFGWNDATDTQDNTAIGVTPNAKATTHAGVAVEYFLAYDGVAGESLRKGHERWISVDSYSLANGLQTDNGTTTGFSFAPTLSLHLDTETGFAQWFQEVTNDGKGQGATLEGVDINGNIVSTLNLGNALVTSVADGGAQGLDVDLSFFQMTMVTQLFNDNDTVAGKDTFKWDFIAHDANTGGVRGKVGTDLGAVVPSKYYMLVDGANGGVTDPAHGGWFNVVDFSMAAGRGVNVSGGGTPETTVPDVANITVLLSDSHALTVLLADMASGTKLGGVIIEGTATNGDPNGEKAVYDLSLGGAFISSINASSGGGYEVQFTASQFQIDTVPYGGKTHNIVEWDAIAQTAKFDPIAPAPGFTVNDDVLTFPGTADLISSPNFSGRDIVYAMGGNDTILASDGNTKVFAGAGNDKVLNIGGNNTFDGGDGIDLLSYTNADGGVNVNLNSLLAQNTIGAGIDIISGFENLDGSDFSDNLTGNNIANIIQGFGGDNVINGLAGNDTIYGGLGNDTMNGGGGVNGVYYDNAFAGVTVDLNSTKAQNTLGAGIDTISNFSILLGSDFADTLTGNALDNVINGQGGSDVISGSGGADILLGEDGNDTITGGAGADILIGGNNADFFVYNAPGEGVDQIVDFKSRLFPLLPEFDTIRIKGAGFGGLAAGALSNAQFQLAASNVAQTTDVRFFFDTNSHILFYDADGSTATSGPVALFTLLGLGALTISDIAIF